MRLLFLVIAPAALWIGILLAFSGGHGGILTAKLRRVPVYMHRIEGIRYAGPSSG